MSGCDSCVGVEAEHHLCNECVQAGIESERRLRALVAALVESNREARAEVRDLKARLKAARKAAQADEPWMDSVPVIERVTDLRNKNWRKP